MLAVNTLATLSAFRPFRILACAKIHGPGRTADAVFFRGVQGNIFTKSPRNDTKEFNRGNFGSFSPRYDICKERRSGCMSQDGGYTDKMKRFAENISIFARYDSR